MTLQERFIQIVNEEPGIGTLAIRRRLILEHYKTRDSIFERAVFNLGSGEVLKKTRKKNGYQWWPADEVAEWQF